MSCVSNDTTTTTTTVCPVSGQRQTQRQHTQTSWPKHTQVGNPLCSYPVCYDVHIGIFRKRKASSGPGSARVSEVCVSDTECVMRSKCRNIETAARKDAARADNKRLQQAAARQHAAARNDVARATCRRVRACVREGRKEEGNASSECVEWLATYRTNSLQAPLLPLRVRHNVCVRLAPRHLEAV
jgi:hypothetical protein